MPIDSQMPAQLAALVSSLYRFSFSTVFSPPKIRVGCTALLFRPLLHFRTIDGGGLAATVIELDSIRCRNPGEVGLLGIDTADWRSSRRCRGNDCRSGFGLFDGDKPSPGPSRAREGRRKHPSTSLGTNGIFGVHEACFTFRKTRFAPAAKVARVRFGHPQSGTKREHSRLIRQHPFGRRPNQ
jgi:hypothetical protein